MIKRCGKAALTAGLATVILSACGENSSDPVIEEPAQPAPVADLVLRGGIVATLDPAIGTTAAIALAGHLILAVGSDQGVSTHIGPSTEIVELEGRFVMPGFIDGHGHFMSLGRSIQILDVTSVKNWDEVVGKVALAVDQAEPGEWIFGRGWHQDKWDSVPTDAVQGVPRNDTLNAVAPDNPVLLGHASGHSAFANDAALAVAGVDDDSADPPGGTIVRSNQGKATGLLRESAQRLVAGAVAQYESLKSEDEIDQMRRQQVYLAGQEALAHGVTSFHDAGASFEIIEFFRQLEGEGALPIRLYVMVRGESNEEMSARLPDFFMAAEGNDFLSVRSIKRQIDGALGSHGAWLLEPYEDLTNTPGLVLEPVEDIERTAEIALKLGFQVNTHAIGDRANRETLDIYQRVFEHGGVDGRDLRWRIEHAQHIDPADVPRFGELGIIASMQGVHCTSDGPWLASRLGEERARLTSYPWRDLIDSGALIANGTDVPVESINAIASYYASISRLTNDGSRFYPEQSMTRREALESYTINNAVAAFEEDLKGTLTPGKLADLVVLSQDLLVVAEERIPETEVDLTVVGGVIRYRRDNSTGQLE